MSMNIGGGSTQKKSALGKGISSLLGNDFGDLATPASQVGQPSGKALHNAILRLSPADIDPNPDQPRKTFRPEELTELAASLKADGFLQPILVTKNEKTGRYTIVAGERRWRASKLAKLETVPVIVREGAHDDLLRLALIENIQRSDLNVIEEAEAYASLIKELGLTQDQCAERVGKDRSSVTNALRLLSLPKSIRDDLVDGRLTMGHGRAILGLTESADMIKARDKILAEKLSVRDTEQLVKTMGEPVAAKSAPASSQPAVIDANLEYLAENMRTLLKTKVRINGTSEAGKIEISYFSASELERILTTIQKF